MLATIALMISLVIPHPARALNWAALRQCESTNRYHIHNGVYGGAYQFKLGTWRSVGGTDNPWDASPAEQDMRAQILYSRRGRQPWPVCGKRL